MGDFRVQKEKPQLVVIAGNKAIRYINGKQDQVAEIDAQSETIREEIESFRTNGLEMS